jgi:hypothetical protein
MLYRFRSKSSADVIALRSSGEALLRALGREPQPQGILEPDFLPSAIRKLEQSIDIDDALRQGQEAANEDSAIGEQDGGSSLDSGSGAGHDAIPLRRRAWPLLQMLRRAQSNGHAVTWG